MGQDRIGGDHALPMAEQDPDQGPSPDLVDHEPQKEREDQGKDMVGPHHLHVRQEELTNLRLDEPKG